MRVSCGWPHLTGSCGGRSRRGGHPGILSCSELHASVLWPLGSRVTSHSARLFPFTKLPDWTPGALPSRPDPVLVPVLVPVTDSATNCRGLAPTLLRHLTAFTPSSSCDVGGVAPASCQGNGGRDGSPSQNFSDLGTTSQSTGRRRYSASVQVHKFTRHDKYYMQYSRK